jgi:hypothetical protein
MLHIATVHYKSPQWIPLQVRHLERFIDVPYQTWTSLEGIDRKYAQHFDHVLEQKGKHGEKLNHLALEISHAASPSDLLMFLDGDAFPIADLAPLLEHGLADAPLLAIRRAENLGDPQPHPSFCLTTVGFWRELPGDWSCGYTWTNGAGRAVTDIGANLLRALELSGVEWRELRRSDLTDVHPLWFGVYGDVIYHHGAGFRTDWKFSRLDRTTEPKLLRTGHVPGLSRLLRGINDRRWSRWREGVESENREESERVFAMIAADDPDWLASLASATRAGS